MFYFTTVRLDLLLPLAASSLICDQIQEAVCYSLPAPGSAETTTSLRQTSSGNILEQNSINNASET